MEINLSNPQNAVLPADSTYTLIIVDNDQAQEPPDDDNDDGGTPGAYSINLPLLLDP